MTIQVRIDGFLALAKGEIEMNSIALVVGQTAAGKSTVVDAIAAAVTGTPGLRGVKAKKDLPLLLHDGFKKAACTVTNGQDSSTMTWPKGDSSTTGRGLKVSRIAAGLSKISALTPAERAQVLAAIYDVSVTAEDLQKALEAGGFSQRAQENVMARVDRDNFDAAHAHFVEDRVKTKGAWEQITKERYGSSKAGAWEPDGWTLALQHETADGLQAAVVAKQKVLEETTGKTAISADRLARLKKEATSLNVDKRAAELAESDLEQSQKALDLAAEDRAKVPDDPEGGGHKCPACGAELQAILSAGVIRLSIPQEGEGGDMSAEDLKNLRIARSMKENHLVTCAHNKRKDERALDIARLSLQKSSLAAEELAVIEADDSPAETAGALEDAKAALAAAQRAHEAFIAKRGADAAHLKITRYEDLIRILAPQGLRKTKQAAAIGRFNTDCLTYSETFGLEGPVWLDDGFEIRMGNRPLGLLSAGQQFIAETVLRLAIAAKDGSELVLIDGAEVIVGTYRAGLLKAVIATNLPAVIAMAVKSADQVPSLARTKLGKTYWIEDGEVVEV